MVLTTPYFVPDDATLSALRIAASGVKMQLILSASNNQRLTAWAQESHYEELLASGVRIALYPAPHFLHAKHMSVDDEIALVGSINLDIPLLRPGLEIGLLCYDAGVVSRMRAVEIVLPGNCGYRAA